MFPSIQVQTSKSKVSKTKDQNQRPKTKTKTNLSLVSPCNLSNLWMCYKRATIREVRAFVIAPGEMGADYHNQTGVSGSLDLPIAIHVCL